MRTLEYTGLPNPWENIDAFVEKAMKHPGIKTPQQLRQFVHRATVDRQARFKIGESSRVVVFFGEDVLSDEPLSNPAWQYIPRVYSSTIAIETPDQRRQRIVIPGLEQTYIFCWHNGWLQDIPDDDFERIVSSPYRRFFKDPEVQGKHVEVRAYDRTERVREPVPTVEEGARVYDYYTKRKHYTPGGVPSPEGA